METHPPRVESGGQVLITSASGLNHSVLNGGLNRVPLTTGVLFNPLFNRDRNWNATVH